MTAARILDISTAEYMADATGGPPTLSQSIANVLLNQSPLHAWQNHPRLGGGREDEETPEMALGSLVHRLLLGAGPEVEVIAADDWRTKAAKEQRDAARAAGRLPVLERKAAEGDWITRKIAERLKERGIVLDGESEVKIAWEENADVAAFNRMVPGSNAAGFAPVQCKGMIDHMKGLGRVVYDLKTTQNASPGACARAVADRGMHVQAAAYVSAVEHLYPALSGRVDYMLIFAEVKKPFGLTVARLGGVFKQYGAELWQRAVATWGRCLAENNWPGYPVEVQSLEAPAYILHQMENEILGERVE